MTTATVLPAPPWTEATLCAYLESLGYRDIGCLHEVDLVETGMPELKGFGFGRPVLLDFKSMGRRHQLVVHTVTSDPFGHDRASDRAAAILEARATFNSLPHHVTSLDVGAFLEDGRMVSLAHAGEFFHLTEYVPGQLYARDLAAVRERGQVSAMDEQRAARLAHYLAGIHRTKRDDPAAWRRRVRDLVGHGEGIMGLVDGDPRLGDPGHAVFLKRVEHAAVDWRWRLRERTKRLSRVHGDFHPFNILFDTTGEFRLLDRSRGEWGEPADDVTALSINYLFFTLLDDPSGFRGPLRRLFDLFWDVYLKASSDEECLEAAPPFLAWRALVLASPLWYPSVPGAARDRLRVFIANVLADTRFRPEEVDRYLQELA